jgi:ferredoxin
MLEHLEKITHGKGTADDIAFLADLGPKIVKGSLCGLGQTAPNPVISTLRYFMDEYESHVKDRKCPALQCNELSELEVHHDNCIKCGLCIKNCPVNAISADYVIDNAVCTRCNSCIEVCPRKTISRVERGTAYSSVEGALR